MVRSNDFLVEWRILQPSRSPLRSNNGTICLKPAFPRYDRLNPIRSRITAVGHCMLLPYDDPGFHECTLGDGTDRWSGLCVLGPHAKEELSRECLCPGGNGSSSDGFTHSRICTLFLCTRIGGCRFVLARRDRIPILAKITRLTVANVSPDPDSELRKDSSIDPRAPSVQ